MQGRGHTGDIDPAEQWVLNPDTGSYELRMPAPRRRGAASAPRGSSQQPASASAGAGRTRTGSRPAARSGGRSQPRERTGRKVPVQRGRRTAPAPARSGRRKPRQRGNGKRKALMWGGGGLGLLLIVGCTGAYMAYRHIDGNINKVDVGIHNPATDGPVNILLIGTDARTGEGNEGYGDAGSVGHADTTLLFHVSEDRSNATVLSIPRDLLVDIPDCPTKQPDGTEKIIPGDQQDRFNNSLGQKGRDPGCTWRTVEELTGIEINHFMMADFNAVKTLSTAVGGVEVCVAKDIDDPKSHLRLKAGRHTIQGEQALAFVRTRYSVGFGSDLSRIELQQQFLSSMLRKMKSSDTLTDPGKLWDLANAATKALTVDTAIGSVDKLVGLAKDLRRVDPKNVTFVTVPVLDNPQNPASVILDEAKARPLFRMIRADKSLSKSARDKKKDDGKKKAVEKAPAAQVRVDVLNGGGPMGAAQGTVDWLQNEQGVPLSTNAGNAPGTQPRTTLEYAPNQAGQAATLAEMMGLPDSALKKTSTDAGPQEPMTLVLGEDFTAAGRSLTAPDKAPEGVKQVNAADKNVCAK